MTDEAPGAVLLVREQARNLRPGLYTIPDTRADEDEALLEAIASDLRTLADRADGQGASVAVAMAGHSGTRAALGIYGSWPDTEELGERTRFDEVFARFGQAEYASVFDVDEIDPEKPVLADFLGGGPA